MPDSDSDSSVELVFESGPSTSSRKAPTKTTSKPISATSSTSYKSAKSVSSNGTITSSATIATSTQQLGPPTSPPLTHYRCIKFDSHTEVELLVHKWHNRNRQAQDQNAEENDLAETLANLNTHSDTSPLNIVYFVLLSGRAESFGIQLVPHRLYSIYFGRRFCIQSFSGFELCFLMRNPEHGFDIRSKLIEPPLYRPKNLPPGAPTPMHFTFTDLQFVALAKPFPFYDTKKHSLDTQSLLPLIVRQISPTTEVGKRMADSLKIQNDSERWRLSCTVKLFGKRQNQQRPPNWLYSSYVQIAKELNMQRADAAKSNRNGPNVIIVGPCDAGKSTLAKIIINYALNDQWSPMYVDLDVGQGAIGVPGMIGAGIVDKHCDLDQEYNFRPGYPMMVHFGGITPDSDKHIHVISINCLARQILHAFRSEEEAQRAQPPNRILPLEHSNLDQISIIDLDSPPRTSNAETAWKRSQDSRKSPLPTNLAKIQKRLPLTKWSGLVINTHGWIFDYGYDSTLDAIHKFGVTNVLVLGDYRLYERIHRDVLGVEPPRAGTNNDRVRGISSASGPWSVRAGAPQVKVHFFQRNFSAVKRHSKLRRKMRMDRFARYFICQNPALPLTIVTIPFMHHPLFRFYSMESFSRFMREQQLDQQDAQGRNWLPIKRDQVRPQDYWTCRVEKAGKDRRGGDFDQVVFYHLHREVLVYLMHRVLSVLNITIDRLQANTSAYFTLRQLLQVRGYARVVQIDLENECLQVELPAQLAPTIGNLVLLEIETVGPRRYK